MTGNNCEIVYLTKEGNLEVWRFLAFHRKYKVQHDDKGFSYSFSPPIGRESLGPLTPPSLSKFAHPALSSYPTLTKRQRDMIAKMR